MNRATEIPKAKELSLNDVFGRNVFGASRYGSSTRIFDERPRFYPGRWIPEYLNDSPAVISAGKAESQIQRWVRDDLAKSLIPFERFTEYGGKVLATTADFIDVLGYEPKCGGHKAEGWALPFLNPASGEILSGNDGRPYWRVRMRHSASSGGKEAKYLSRKKSGQHAFILPEVHRFLMNNPDAPVICTEGEKKAWCATLKGIHTIGLVGNYGWKIGDTRELLPELQTYALTGRTFIVVWDSDAADNKLFHASTKQLATTLASLECELKELILPGNAAAKVGVDDFIKEYGHDAFRALLATAQAVSPDGRSLSSAENGAKGGRPSDIKDIADAVAERWISENGGKLLAYYRSSWYEYSDGVYMKRPKEFIDAHIMGVLRKDFPTRSTTNTSDQCKRHLAASDMFFLNGDYRVPFNRNDGASVKYCLNLKNGMLDPENPSTGLLPHSPDIFSINQQKYDYIPEARCPKFMAYLETVQPDEEARSHLAMLMGLALVPDTSYNVFFILYGEGGTGKSVFLHVLEHLVGIENTSSLALTRFANPFAMEELTEKLLNILSDLPTDDGQGNTLAHVEGMLKMVTSGESLRVEKKRVQDTYKSPAMARLVMATNSLPRFADTSSGIWDRARLIPFNVRVRGEGNDNPHLKDELVAEELPGILNFALAGLKELRNIRQTTGRDVFPILPAGKDILEDHRGLCDSVRGMADEHLVYDADSYMECKRVYSLYTGYCSSNGLKPKGMRNFTPDLKRLFPAIYSDRKTIGNRKPMVWFGLRARTGDTAPDSSESAT